MSVEAEKPARSWGRIALWSLAIPVGLFALLVVKEAIDGPPTYKEVADREAAECIESGGVGTSWRASSGTTLENHCRFAATARARLQMCSEHPDAC